MFVLQKHSVFVEEVRTACLPGEGSMLCCIEALLLYTCLQVWTTESWWMRIYAPTPAVGRVQEERRNCLSLYIAGKTRNPIKDLCCSSKITSSLEAEASFFIVFTSLVLTARSSLVKSSASFVLRDSSLKNRVPSLQAPIPALSHNFSCL